MANVNLSASFLELSRRSNNPVAKDFSLGGWGGGDSGGKKNWEKTINIGMKSHAMVRRHAHPEKETKI